MREADHRVGRRAASVTENRRWVEVAQARVLRHPWIRLLNLRLAAVARPILERSTPDATSCLVAGSALVIAPHPDDESIGCGGLIAAKTAGDVPVSIVVVSDGARSHRSKVIDSDELAAIRAQEVTQAATTLGVPTARLHMLGFDDRTVAERSDELTALLAALLREIEPAQLIIPSDRDANADHRAVCRAALEAAAMASSPPEVLSYLVWFWTPEAWVDQGTSTIRKLGQLVSRVWSFLRDADRISFDPGPHAATKSSAIRCHRSQLENLTGEPDWEVIEPHVLDLLVGRRELYIRRTDLVVSKTAPVMNGTSS